MVFRASSQYFEMDEREFSAKLRQEL